MLRAQGSGFNGLLETVARMPWWAGIVLAFVAYVMLHPFAIMDVADATPMAEPVRFASKAFWRGLADTGQYVVPAIMLVAPGVAGVLLRILRGRGA